MRSIENREFGHIFGDDLFSIQANTDNDLTIFADLNMLKTILRNLISNAIKFTNAKGHIDISAEKNDSFVKIFISDTGIGIEPEMINSLFDISKIHSTPGTDDEKGTGLGLLLCKDLIEKHQDKFGLKCNRKRE